MSILLGLLVEILFFFSSRRRHTRCSRDWSSDVCSSDLRRTVRFAVPICFEASRADFARRAAGHGADFLLNITSEGVFGAPVYTHMWALATLRAVENRVAIVRVGNNGISGFIEPSGRTQSVLRGKRTGRPFLEEGTLVDRVPVAEGGGGTFYTR